MTHRNLVPFAPAGGEFLVPGDRMNNEQALPMLANGLWGLFRVLP
ncbi:hypothetical protein [Sorangium cellulosum]|nr:hypothetical protein [Sorangium cellulosum]